MAMREEVAVGACFVAVRVAVAVREGKDDLEEKCGEVDERVEDDVRVRAVNCDVFVLVAEPVAVALSVAVPAVSEAPVSGPDGIRP